MCPEHLRLSLAMGSGRLSAAISRQPRDDLPAGDEGARVLGAAENVEGRLEIAVRFGRGAKKDGADARLSAD